MVLPDVRHRDPYALFAPRLSSDRLGAVRDFLAPRLPASADLAVRNARFAPVRVRANVRLHADVDEGRAVAALVAAWTACCLRGRSTARSTSSSAARSGSVASSRTSTGAPRSTTSTASSSCSATARPGGGSPVRDRAVVTAPDTVLVSGGDHEIVVLRDEQDEGERWTGVGHLAVAVDFTVG